MKDPYIRGISECQAIDGDTFACRVDLGFYVDTRMHVRLLGVSAPELFSGTAEERARGAEARDILAAWFASHMTHGPMHLQTQRDRRSFNRYIGEAVCAAGHSTLDLPDIAPALFTRS